MPTEITRVVVCNTTGGAVSASLYHDDDGGTFDATTALMEAKSIPANDYLEITSFPGTGIVVRKDGQIGVKTSSGSALTFTLYGITANIGQL